MLHIINVLTVKMSALHYVMYHMAENWLKPYNLIMASLVQVDANICYIISDTKDNTDSHTCSNSMLEQGLSNQGRVFLGPGEQIIKQISATMSLFRHGFGFVHPY